MQTGEDDLHVAHGSPPALAAPQDVGQAAAVDLAEGCTAVPPASGMEPLAGQLKLAGRSVDRVDLLDPHRLHDVVCRSELLLADPADVDDRIAHGFTPIRESPLLSSCHSP